MINQRAGFDIAPFVFVLAQDGHESLREGTLRKHPAQQVGQFEGNEKGIGGQACAKSPGNDKVADKAEDAGEKGHSADRSQRAQQIHCLMPMPD